MDDREGRKRRLTCLRVQRFRIVRRKMTENANSGIENELCETVTSDNNDEAHNFNDMDVMDDADHSCYQPPQLQEPVDEDFDVENVRNAGNNELDDQLDNKVSDVSDVSEASEENSENADDINESNDEVSEVSEADQENLENADGIDESDDEVSEEEQNLHELHAEDQEWDDVAQLREWALNSNISQTKLDNLLRILRRRLLPELPACSKTFLKTALTDYHIQNLAGPDGTSIAEYVYFGIAKNLERTVNTALHEGEEMLQLQFNIDGLPLYKSSSRQFWPILCKVQYQPDIYEPFPVAIFSGVQKPNDVDEYLGPFIEEINTLLDTGIIITGRQFEVRIACFICDTPARSFVKCIKGHGGYYACERCTVKGERCQNRTIYTSIRCNERSNESFRNRDDPQHHTGVSPLTLIRPHINMISLFVLDFMHLCCLGIMKKLLIDCWLQGSLTTKLSHRNKILLSQRLINLQSQIPIEFQRTTRSVFDVSKWKATEFRFFLLYGGPVVLKKILPERLYKHFLLFSVSCRILCSKKLALRYHNHAKVYLRSFVSVARHLYGKTSQVMNMHNLIHLADDVENTGRPLSEITAFPFENMLGKLKKMLHSGHRPLAQVCRRLQHNFFANNEKVTLPPPVIILRKLHPTPTGITPVLRVRCKEATITIKAPDNVVQLQNGKLLKIDNMHIPPNGDVSDIKISGLVLRKTEPMFQYPCNSKILNMWNVKLQQCNRITCPLRRVALKMVILNISADQPQRQDNMCAMPFLHI